jgi:hypothetical protein
VIWQESWQTHFSVQNSAPPFCPPAPTPTPAPTPSIPVVRFVNGASDRILIVDEGSTTVTAEFDVHVPIDMLSRASFDALQVPCPSSHETAGAPAGTSSGTINCFDFRKDGLALMIENFEGALTGGVFLDNDDGASSTTVWALAPIPCDENGEVCWLMEHASTRRRIYAQTEIGGGHFGGSDLSANTPPYPDQRWRMVPVGP